MIVGVEPDIRALQGDELQAAAGAAARALQDDPVNVASYGDDPLLRLSHVHALFSDLFARESAPQFGAVAGRCVVGVAGVLPPGACVGTMMGPYTEQVLASEPAELGNPMRAAHFWATWARHDLAEDHWHIGPVGVEPGYQNRGIGRRVMLALCAYLDEHGAVGWLETNKERNVRFYTSLGFELTAEDVTLDVPSWFMRRDPQG